MWGYFPVDAMSGVLEIVCYCFTVAAALVSCLISLRF